MTRWIWVDGRFSWTFIIGTVLFTLSLIFIDLVWRTVVMPAETLLIGAVVLELGIACALIGFSLLNRRRRSRLRE